MNAKEQKRYLQSIIEAKLSPLIDSDYVYWDLPYHINIGDTLIWQGTLGFLEGINYKCLDVGNSTTANMSDLKKDTIILLQGGGNFGDIYGSSQNFRKEVVNRYPNNKIVILPQTIYFKDKKVEELDLKFFSEHQNLYLCVRDQSSYDLACRYLSKDKVLFLPDMAFCIKDEILIKVTSTGKKLLMSRIDIEATGGDFKYIEKVDVQSDWPTFEKEPLNCLLLRYLNGLNRRINKNRTKTILSKVIDMYAVNIIRPNLIGKGIDFINGFDEVYTTRLHGCILSLLLDKKITLLDNSYGKNKGYYDAWLKSSNNIKVESC
ncbi:polysaccharide pyruvyl transferase family protein [Acinetobacter vivianii]|uniref:polysaccharide pyruvyl transferase family protein n=1 Tax=Acinetobacter vivianii TaxID=1776742 RepID=UPI002DBD8110|nr:polysaccharide pyruvyl transferase family protein [Acinetobacter vivianii]MEB6481022.1 polysaccharide pyruvyl transferase family protein [Acinetobacter vivianii]MEB6659306.1 polysaccharide pyruvyl transferase family protein [Acinetobacter vivianii]